VLQKNKQTFSTTGKGDLVIDVPNGYGEMQLRLSDVLYSAEVGYTLVFVGRLDEAGLSVTFRAGKCMLASAKCGNPGLAWPSEPNIVGLARPNIVM
jgi:hypothetical protein